MGTQSYNLGPIQKSEPHLPEIDKVIGSPAIAGNGEVAGLGVQGEQLQVHRAAKGE